MNLKHIKCYNALEINKAWCKSIFCEDLDNLLQGILRFGKHWHNSCRQGMVPWTCDLQFHMFLLLLLLAQPLRSKKKKQVVSLYMMVHFSKFSLCTFEVEENSRHILTFLEIYDMLSTSWSLKVFLFFFLWWLIDINLCLYIR